MQSRRVGRKGLGRVGVYFAGTGGERRVRDFCGISGHGGLQTARGEGESEAAKETQESTQGSKGKQSHCGAPRGKLSGKCSSNYTANGSSANQTSAPAAEADWSGEIDSPPIPRGGEFSNVPNA